MSFVALLGNARATHHLVLMMIVMMMMVDDDDGDDDGDDGDELRSTPSPRLRGSSPGVSYLIVMKIRQ